MYTHISFMNLLNEEFKLSFDIETTISHVYYPPSKWKVSYTVYDSVYTLISCLLLILRAIKNHRPSASDAGFKYFSEHEHVNEFSTYFTVSLQ